MAVATCKHRVTLSDLEVDYLQSIPAGSDRLLALWRLIMPGQFDTAETVTPWDYAIPRDQWIAVAMGDFNNGGGYWLNNAPSSF